MADSCNTAFSRFQAEGGLHRGPSKFMTMVALGLISISVGACTRTAVEMGPLELARLKESPRIGAVHYEASGLKVHTFTSALFGQFMGPIFGPFHTSGSAHNLGAQIVGESGLEEPTLELKAHFIAAVTTELGLTSIENIPQPPSPENYLMLRHKFHDGFLFVFQSTNVDLAFSSLSSPGYHLIYEGQGQLWSFKARSTVWESPCHVVKENASPSPALEELTANRGQLLKQLVSEATRECASQLVAHFLGSGKALKSSAAP